MSACSRVRSSSTKWTSSEPGASLKVAVRAMLTSSSRCRRVREACTSCLKKPLKCVMLSLVATIGLCSHLISRLMERVAMNLITLKAWLRGRMLDTERSTLTWRSLVMSRGSDKRSVGLKRTTVWCSRTVFRTTSPYLARTKTHCCDREASTQWWSTTELIVREPHSLPVADKLPRDVCREEVKAQASLVLWVPSHHSHRRALKI